MSDNSVAVAAFLLGIVVGGAGIGAFVDSYMSNQAVRHNCAQHNPTTGDFQWLPPQGAE